MFVEEMYRSFAHLLAGLASWRLRKFFLDGKVNLLRGAHRILKDVSTRGKLGNERGCFDVLANGICMVLNVERK